MERDTLCFWWEKSVWQGCHFTANESLRVRQPPSESKHLFWSLPDGSKAHWENWTWNEPGKFWKERGENVEEAKRGEGRGEKLHRYQNRELFMFWYLAQHRQIPGLKYRIQKKQVRIPPLMKVTFQESGERLDHLKMMPMSLHVTKLYQTEHTHTSTNKSGKYKTNGLYQGQYPNCPITL